MSNPCVFINLDADLTQPAAPAGHCTVWNMSTQPVLLAHWNMEGVVKIERLAAQESFLLDCTDAGYKDALLVIEVESDVLVKHIMEDLTPATVYAITDKTLTVTQKTLSATKWQEAVEAGAKEVMRQIA
jgi:hypothetical protein